MAFGSGYLGNFAQNALNQEKFNASQSTPYSFDDGTSASNDAMAAQQQQLQAYQQMQRQQAYMSTPGGRLGAAAGGLLDSIVGGIRGATNFNGMPSSPQQAQQLGQAATTDQSADLKQAFAQNVSSIMQTNSTSDAPTNMGQVYYEAASNLAKDPRFQGRPDLAPYVAKAINWETKNMGFSPAKPLSPEDQQQKLLNDQKTQQSLAENVANKQYQVVDMTDDGSGVPTWKPYGDPISLFNSDGSPNADYAAQVMAAKKLAATNGAKNIMTMPQKDFYDSKTLAERQKALDAQAKLDHADAQRQQDVANLDQNSVDYYAGLMGTGKMTTGEFNQLAGRRTDKGVWADAVRDKAAMIAQQAGYDTSPSAAQARQAALVKWTAGGGNDRLVKAATSSEHLAELEQMQQQIHQNTFTPGSALYNKLLSDFGLPQGIQVKPFELTKQLYSMEAASMITQRGGTEEDRKAISQQISSADTPQVLQSVLHTQEKLWMESVRSNAYAYENSVKGNKFIGDATTDPALIRRYTKYNPVEIPSNSYGKLYYNSLPSGTWVTQNGSKAVQKGGAVPVNGNIP